MTLGPCREVGPWAYTIPCGLLVCMVNPGLEMPINCPIESGKSSTVTAGSVASNLNLLRISSYVMITLGTTARTFAAITSAKASAVYCPDRNFKCQVNAHIQNTI